MSVLDGLVRTTAMMCYISMSIIKNVLPIGNHSDKIILYPGIILCMCPANEGRHYIVTSSLIGWAQTQNDPKPPDPMMTKFTDTKKDRQFDNFVITDGNKSCHNDNLCAISDDKVVKLMVFCFYWMHICFTRPQWVSPCCNDSFLREHKKKYLQ